MGSADWQEDAYREAYEKETRGIRRRLESDPACGAEDLEGILKSLYIMDGQDWAGRGELQNTTLAASIAAYEALVGELKSAKNRK